MNKSKTGATKLEITSLRDLEREFIRISKLFVGKETDLNWEDRDHSVKQLRALLVSDRLEEFRDEVTKGIHDAMASLVKSIHSLRTQVASEALFLIIDISQTLGNTLDQYTMEILLSNLLKCSSVTKKIIATKASETTNTLLSNTNYYTKMTVLLCKTSAEKNVQLRQFAATYLQTLLETHGSKEQVRSMMESANSHVLVHQFLKKGLVDASPDVRDACRQMYWAYHRFWSPEAEKLFDSMDPAIQRQIKKSKLTPSTSDKPQPSTSNKPRMVPQLLTKRSNSTSSITSRRSSSSSTSSSSQGNTANVTRSVTPTPTSRSVTPTPLSTRSTTPTPSTSTSTSTPLFKKPVLKKSTSAQGVPVIKRQPRPPIPTNSAQSKPSVIIKRQPCPSIPATSTDKLNSIPIQKMSRLSHMSNASAPATTVSHQITTMQATATTRRTQSEFHHQSVLASASLLHMLKSSDVQMRCKGIRQLSERLKSVPYHPTQPMTLPPNVPSKIDLLPLLMDFLTRHDLDLEVYKTLMSWESLAGIFVYVMSVNYYCPTLIIAHGQKAQATRKEAQVMAIYSKGLQRVKMFLKRNDPELAQRLLDILQSILGDQKLLDASVKRDIQLFPMYKDSLLYGLLTWMDEIVCDFIGLPEDEDDEMLMEGSKWLNVSDDTCSAGQWFDINHHVQLYTSCVIQQLLSVVKKEKEKEMYTILCKMVGHLKMANQRVFENELKNLDTESLTCIEKALGLVKEYDDFSISFAADDSSILMDEACGIATDDVVIEELVPIVALDQKKEDEEMIDIDKQQEKEEIKETGDQVEASDHDSNMTQDVGKIKLMDHTNTLPQDPPPPHHTMAVDSKLPTIAENSSSETNKEDSSPILESKPVVTRTTPPPPLSNPFTNFIPTTPIKNIITKTPRTPLSTPTRRISNLEEEEEEEEGHGYMKKKKKRKTSDESHQSKGIECLKSFISSPLITVHANPSIFQEIQQLIEEKAIVWSQKEKDTTLLFATLDATCECLKSKQQEGEPLRLDAIRTIKKLLVNQSSYLKSIDISVDQVSFTRVYNLKKVLVICHDVDIYNHINTQASKTIEVLLTCWSIEKMLNIFWQMANDQDILEGAGEYALAIVFTYINRLVPQVSKATLQQLLKKYGIDLIKKNLNHDSIILRRPSVYLAGELYQRLGESFYKQCRGDLPTEQLRVFNNYISNQK